MHECVVCKDSVEDERWDLGFKTCLKDLCRAQAPKETTVLLVKVNKSNEVFVLKDDVRYGSNSIPYVVDPVEPVITSTTTYKIPRKPYTPSDMRKILDEFEDEIKEMRSSLTEQEFKRQIGTVIQQYNAKLRRSRSPISWVPEKTLKDLGLPVKTVYKAFKYKHQRYR